MGAAPPEAAELATMNPHSLAAVLAMGDPQVWRALLDRHGADDGGRCRICRRHGCAAELWPCSLWCAADRARAIVEGPVA